MILNLLITGGRVRAAVTSVTIADPGGTVPVVVLLYELSALTGPGSATLEN